MVDMAQDDTAEGILDYFITSREPLCSVRLVRHYRDSLDFSLIDKDSISRQDFVCPILGALSHTESSIQYVTYPARIFMLFIPENGEEAPE